MELSTIIRLKILPPVGLRPNLFPSGALVYSEPDNSLYYAGGDDGEARATFIQLVNNSSFGGTDINRRSLKDLGHHWHARYQVRDDNCRPQGEWGGCRDIWL